MAATALKSQGVALAAVDAVEEVNKDLAAEHGIKGFPTLKVWNKNQGAALIDYEGGRTQDAIVDFMKKEGRPLVSEIQALSETTGKVFVHVGDSASNEALNKVAAEKKAYLSFHWVSALEGQVNGSVLVVDNGVVTATLEKDGDLAQFVSDNA